MNYISFKDRITKYVNSLYYIMTLAILSFLCWSVKGNWCWCFLSIYSILCFLPLFSKDGRGYLPLIFFSVIISNEDIHFKGGIPISMIYSMIMLGISLFIYLLRHRPQMITGKIFFSLIVLYCVFLISYLYSSIRNGRNGRVGILYLIALFVLLCIYALMNSILGKEETIPYLCMTLAVYAIAASLEAAIVLLKKQFVNPTDIYFSLGWSYTPQTVSSFLTLCLPFFSILIHRKKLFWFIPEVFVLIIILIISSDSSLISLMFFVVPNVILTMKGYSKSYPYYVMLSLLGIGITFGILMGVNGNFNFRVSKAISRLNFFSQESIELYKPSIQAFIKNPLLGSSITSMVKENGTISLPNSTILSVLQLGGAFGIAAYIVYEVFIYLTIFKKNSKEKWFIFLFLLNVELIGLIDNTIFNIAILMIVLMTMSVYQQSGRPDDVIIHDDYFSRYNKDEIVKTSSHAKI